MWVKEVKQVWNTEEAGDIAGRIGAGRGGGQKGRNSYAGRGTVQGEKFWARGHGAGRSEVKCNGMRSEGRGRARAVDGRNGSGVSWCDGSSYWRSMMTGSGQE